MPVKLVDAPAPGKIKSQEELDKVFRLVTGALNKTRTAETGRALDVYNKVIADGRFVKEFATDPGGVAKS